MRKLYHRYDLPYKDRGRGDARMAGRMALLLLAFMGGFIVTAILYAVLMVLSTAFVAVQP